MSEVTMSRFANKQNLIEFGRAVAFLLVLLSGLCAIFYSQASSPNYRMLFRGLLPIALFHFVASTIYFVRVRHWTRWAAFVLEIFAILSFSELSLRVWF
jgi:hypothetical protein